MKRFFTSILSLLMIAMLSWAEGSSSKPNGISITFKDASTAKTDYLFTDSPVLSYTDAGHTLVVTTTLGSSQFDVLSIAKLTHVVVQNDADGISHISTVDGKPLKIYGLDGREISNINDAKGIIIINGRKTVIK